jgi:hypothetical protein
MLKVSAALEQTNIYLSDINYKNSFWRALVLQYPGIK